MGKRVQSKDYSTGPGLDRGARVNVEEETPESKSEGAS